MRTPGKQAGCFYSSLTVAQLGEMASACALPVSGTKAELVARLRSHPTGKVYADEGRSGTLSRSTLEIVGHRPGLLLSDVKASCRAKGLAVTGNKAALVLSLLRAAGQPAGSVPAKRPRAPSTKAADPGALEARLLRLCEANPSWSNQKAKEHGERVVSGAVKLLSSELEDKGALARGDADVAAVATRAVLRALVAGALPGSRPELIFAASRTPARHTSLHSPCSLLSPASPRPLCVSGWPTICRPSYGNASYDLGLLEGLVRSVAGLGDSLPAALRQELAGLCAALARVAGAHGMPCFDKVAAAFGAAEAV